ncbi:MAG: biopolymer transporter ExbD [Fimbriimonadaceae bacterium]|nr:biopolymer transporter ExbD [Fimbriimonadaceae bacterium]
MAFGSPDRRGRGGRRNRRKPFTEINIVPLTDVILVLLMIFMVTAQFITAQSNGMRLNLPTAAHVDNLDDLGGLRVTVDPAGSLTINGTPVVADQLAAELRRLQQSPQQLVIVEGDRQTVLQHVVNIMDAAQDAGLANVVLATGADGPAPPPADPAAGPLPAQSPAPPAGPAAAAPSPAAPPLAEEAAAPSPFVTPPTP